MNQARDVLRVICHRLHQIGIERVPLEMSKTILLMTVDTNTDSFLVMAQKLLSMSDGEMAIIIMNAEEKRKRP